MPHQSLANRRSFLKTLAATASVGAASPLLTGCTPGSFEHGVASGDPWETGVVIWTRVTARGVGPALVRWEVARDKHFSRVVHAGDTLTDETVDYTVKVEVDGLRRGKKYYYRFICSGQHSSLGTTRTLPKRDVEHVSFAVLSCSNYPAGYFHVYREVAQRHKQIDYALHLGDYIYEYGRDGYASEQAEEMGREVEPPTETIRLAEYRTRYAQYRTDPDLAEVHRLLPFIVVWDDHEITNDTYRSGAENHDPSEGDFEERKAAALQAYFEWMPIRETERRDTIYRSFDFGRVLSLHMLDTRVVARDQQLDYTNYLSATGFDGAAFAADLGDPARSLLGDEQLAYLQEALVRSDATWQVLGQQVLMTSLPLPAPLLFQQVSLEAYQQVVAKAQTDPSSLTASELDLLQSPQLPLNLDAWDGYPAAREAVLQTAVALGKNLISLAGDTHNAWASNLATLDGTAAGVEFATSSVSSPGLEDYLSNIEPELLAQSFVQLSDQLVWTNTQHRGFMLLRVTKQAAQATWLFVDDVKSKDYSVLDDRTQELRVEAGALTIEQ